MKTHEEYTLIELLATRYDDNACSQALRSEDRQVLTEEIDNISEGLRHQTWPKTIHVFGRFTDILHENMHASYPSRFAQRLLGKQVARCPF